MNLYRLICDKKVTGPSWVLCLGIYYLLKKLLVIGSLDAGSKDSKR